VLVQNVLVATLQLALVAVMVVELDLVQSEMEVDEMHISVGAECPGGNSPTIQICGYGGE